MELNFPRYGDFSLQATEKKKLGIAECMARQILSLRWDDNLAD